MKQAPSGVSSFLEKQVLGTGASKKCPCYPGDLLNTLDLQRSKSLSNLPSKSDSNDDEEKFNSTKNLSCSSEALPRLWSSADDAAQTELSEDNPISKKAKACLTKMDSFDKSDGYDEFSFDYFGVGTDTTLHFENNNSGVFCQSLSSSHSPTEFKSSSTIEPTEPEKRIVTSPMSMSSSSSTLAGDDQPQKTRSILDLPLSPSSKESDKEFGWENPIPDLSPIYEESENLASTIAKLRCLLSERQSQHSLGSQSSFGSSESEPKSAQSDPGRYSLERSRFTFFHKDSSSSLASAKSSSSTDSAHPQWFAEEEISEASEGVSVDGKVFVSVSIPTTEVHSEAAGFQYTMYIIQYDAIYLCEVVSSTGLKDGASDLSQVSDHKMVLQTNIVKRRFREFLSLQSALEEDPLLRASMKGVKGPNKWLNLPFSKLDSATISSRRQFLEKYLQALIQRSPINTSAQLKDFLAYGSDSSISFVKKPLEINIPRLDKLLARTVSGVSGVFHSIKTALPNFDSADVSLQESLGASSICMSSKGNIHLMAADVTPTKVSPSVEKDRQDYLKDYDVQLDITAEEQVCELEGSLLTAITATSELSSPMDGVSESRILNLDNTGENILANTSAVPFLPTSSCDLLSVNQGMEGETGSKQSSPYSCKLNPLTSFWAEIGVSTSRVHPLQRQESQDSFGTGESDTDSSHPLFLSLVDALVEIVGSTDHPITRQGATLLITRLWAQPITHFLQSELDKILSEDLFQVFFNRLRFCIGNSGRGVDEAEGTSLELESQDLFKERLQQSKKDLERVLRKYIPSSLELMLGSESLKDSLTLFIESLQHPPLNRDFGLHLIDLIFVHLLLPV
ncbi:Sorting nexin-19 [Armadillidium vulgare]|nr:Sorting nexin-19 [Armadillidium vulgare]